jgi:hypothetical protein
VGNIPQIATWRGGGGGVSAAPMPWPGKRLGWSLALPTISDLQFVSG